MQEALGGLNDASGEDFHGISYGPMGLLERELSKSRATAPARPPRQPLRARAGFRRETH